MEICGDFRLLIEKHGYKSAMAKSDSERKESGWIDPDGNWYNVPWSYHSAFACRVLIEQDQIERALSVPAQDITGILVDDGWILIHSDWRNGIVLHGSSHMNKSQYDSLLSFFGNSTLSRKWTIDEMWQHSKNYHE